MISATKSNGIVHTMPFWDGVVADVATGYADIACRPVLIGPQGGVSH